MTVRSVVPLSVPTGDGRGLQAPKPVTDLGPVGLRRPHADPVPDEQSNDQSGDGKHGSGGEQNRGPRHGASSTHSRHP